MFSSQLKVQLHKKRKKGKAQQTRVKKFIYL